MLTQCKLYAQGPAITQSCAHFWELKIFFTDLISLKFPATDAKFDHLARADNKEVHTNSVGKKAERAEEPLALGLA